MFQTGMLLGYNTNGFSSHRLEDAVAVLARIGYRSIAVTLEQDVLDPPDRRGVGRCVARLRPLLARYGLRVTIETGSRFILDPWRKHHPTLMSRSADDRGRRIELIKAAIDIAAAVSADSVALWSGCVDDAAHGVIGAVEDAANAACGDGGDVEDVSRAVAGGADVMSDGGGAVDRGAGVVGNGAGAVAAGDDAAVFDRLTTSLSEILTHAEAGGVRLSFEPEPGMFIDTMARYAALHDAIDHPLFGLTLDVGHVHCLGDGDVGEHIARWRDVLFNVHIEDMRRGVHEHLMFGDGDMDIDRVLAGLRASHYDGPVHVELSRHSHDAVAVATRAHAFLAPRMT